MDPTGEIGGQGPRFGVRARMIATFGAMALMMVAVSTLAVVSFLDVDSRLSVVMEDSLAGMRAAAELAQQAESVVGQAPALLGVSSATERETVGYRVRDQLDWLNALIEQVSREDHDPETLTRVRGLALELRQLLATLSRHVDRRLELEARSRDLLDALLDLDRRLGALAPLRDGAATGSGTQAWRREASQAVALLLGTMGTTDPRRADDLERRFIAHLEAMAEATIAFPSPRMDGMTAEIRGLALDSRGVFAHQRAMEAVHRATEGTLARNRLVSDMLVAAAAGLMDSVMAASDREAESARADMGDRTALLLTLSMFCLLLVGVLILHLQRAVLDPLARLRDAMLHPPGHGPPQLEKVQADDEIGDMARALTHYAQAIEDREQALRDSEGRFRDLAENVPGVLFQWRVPAIGSDETPGFVYLGPRCVELFGVTPEEARADWRRLGLSSMDQETWLERSNRAARTLEGWVQEGDREDHRAKGCLRWWRLMAAPTPEDGAEDGDLGGAVIFNGVLTDITTQKISEREMRVARHRAERTLADLRATQETLIRTEKLASLGQLVAGIAHEINTPLGTGITGASYLEQESADITRQFEENGLRRSDLGAFLSQTRETARLIHANLDRAARLVQGFKQVAVDQVTDERRTFDLSLYVEEVLAGLAPRLRKTKLTVTRDIPEGLVLDSYPGAFFRILTNLVMNSMVHGFDEGAEGTITITGRRIEDDWIEILYADDGKGIPATIQPLVFDPFFTTRRGRGGTGLGLNIVHNLTTQALGGTLSLVSDLGEGVRFTLRLPRHAPEAPANAAPVTAAPVSPLPTASDPTPS